MKKISIFAVAGLAMTFAACGGKTGNTAEVDSLLADTVAVEETVNATADAANGVVALLQEQIEKADPEQVKSIAQTITDKVSELLKANNIEGVETYTAVINNFIAENADKLKENGIAKTITEAISNVAGLPSDVIETAKSAAEGVKSEALTSAISALASGGNVLDAVKNAATQAVSDAAAEGAEAVEEGKAAVEDAKAAVEAAPEAAEKAAKEAASDAVDQAAAAAKSKLGL